MEGDGARRGIDLDAIFEMIQNDDHSIYANGLRMNNESTIEADMDIDTDYEENAPIRHEDPVAPVMYEEAPTPSFQDVSWVNDAVSRSRVPSRQPLSTDLYIGQLFRTKEQLVQALKAYHIKKHVEFKVGTSNRTVLALKCKSAPSCSWSLRASFREALGAFKISTMKEPHTCLHSIINDVHGQISAKFVATHCFSVVKQDLTMTPVAIQAMINTDFGYDISYDVAWTAKQKIISRLFGSWEDSFKALPSFMDALQRSNPGTQVVWMKVPSSTPGEYILKRVFWAFAPCIERFKHCRPVISVDGTHLYGKYKGKILVAVSYDANNGLFPLAFALVEEENNDSWAWFMTCLREKVTQREGLCIISDRHAGIKNAMKQAAWKEPLAYHRYCVRHVASNFNTKFKNSTLKKKVMVLAYQTALHKFEEMFDQIAQLDTDTSKPKSWLDKIELERWTLTHDGGLRYGEMTTNMSEIFNNVLKGARSLPITAIVQLTFYRLNEYFAVRRKQGEDRRLEFGSRFLPLIDIKLHLYSERANYHYVRVFRDEGYYQVTTGASRNGDGRKGGHLQTVDLNKRTCTCQKWMLFHIPCSHVLAVCQKRHLDSLQYIDICYTLFAYISSWTPLFHPIPDKRTWPPDNHSILVPDEKLRRDNPGRTPSVLLHNEMDARAGRSKVHCGICKGEGHNKKTCPNKNKEG